MNMNLRTRTAVLNSLAVVNLPRHDGRLEDIILCAKFHGKKVKIIGYCEGGKLKVELTEKGISRFKARAILSFFDLILEPAEQSAW